MRQQSGAQCRIGGVCSKIASAGLTAGIEDCLSRLPPRPNPSQPPLVRGGAGLALPLTRGSWRGFEPDEQSEFISRSNTRRSPTVEKTRFLWPMLPCVPSRSIASSTLSRLWAGSPMPMNTTLLTARRLRASTTWATISALPSCRCRPARPLMQNTPHGTTRYAQTPARQQHALHHLAIGQFDQQSRDTFVIGKSA